MGTVPIFFYLSVNLGEEGLMGQLKTGDEIRKDGAFLNRKNRPLYFDLNRFNH